MCRQCCHDCKIASVDWLTAYYDERQEEDREKEIICVFIALLLLIRAINILRRRRELQLKNGRRVIRANFKLGHYPADARIDAASPLIRQCLSSDLRIA